MPHMKKQENKIRFYERRTSWKVVVINVFVIFSCAALLYYIYNLRNSIKNQRVNIDKQDRALALSSELTQSVHKAQTAANFFAYSDDKQYFDEFNSLVEAIYCISDSIIQNDTSEITLRHLVEIQNLIEKKGQLSYVMSQHFYYNPLAEIDAALEGYTPPTPTAPTYSAGTSENTVVQKPKEKKGFWKRLSEVFHPEEDSIVQVTTHRIDTVFSKSVDSTPYLVNDLRSLSDKAKGEYMTKVKEYEAKTSELILADNQLSEQIAAILLRLNKNIIDSTVHEIENSEALIDQKTRMSFMIGGVAMLLIILFAILILSDVSKIYRARRAAEEAKKKTEEIMNSRHKLLLSVSHDIKTPLTSIIGNVELMHNDDNEKEVTSIQQSADHILNLLTNLLDFSSLEQGKLKVDKSLFNINKLCSETAAMFEPIAQKKNLHFNYSSSIEDRLSAFSDSLKIKQIASNLISNSIKYTLEGEVSFKVSIENDKLVMDITDTGVGIPAEKINDIFTPFVRIETYNTFAEGSGYGLTVVKGLVDLLEGDIQVESEVGNGTHFCVHIPIEYELKDDADESQVAEKHPKNILIIDDDDTLLSVTDNMLRRLGHHAIACRSKADIESALENLTQYDCVLTDREMGALSGNDILKRFKEKAPQLTVLLMTARSEYSQGIAQEEGFDGFLKKPFNLNDLEQIFGQGIDIEETNSPTSATPNNFAEDFPAFSEIMGNDSEAITAILKAFVASTAEDMMALNNHIEADDCTAAKNLCHKMLPMFKQLERDTAFLSKMNDLRSAGQSYPQWKDDALAFLQQADELMELLETKYGIS